MWVITQVVMIARIGIRWYSVMWWFTSSLVFKDAEKLDSFNHYEAECVAMGDGVK